MYNHLVENDLREDASKHKYSKGNLSAEDLSAKVYKVLQNNCNLVILPADKGGTVSEIDAYINSALDQGWSTDFLITPHPVCAAYYGLPKIHNKLSDPPLRPKVFGNDCLMEPLSQFVFFFIQKLVPSFPALLCDTTDVIEILENVNVESNDIHYMTKSMWTFQIHGH
uniref:Uncharacterized protein n=1 Tax=Oncorhynchus tshawytscha TaxID=74940 RepID=A0A8C8EXB5_ONCTS